MFNLKLGTTPDWLWHMLTEKNANLFLNNWIYDWSLVVL